MIKKITLEILDYVKVIVIAVIIATLISTQVFTFSQVQQRSMEKTLVANDALFIEKVTYHFSKPKYGDIVVLLKGGNVDTSFFGKIERLYNDLYNKFRHIDNMNRLVKRVIGLPGDEIDIKDGKVYVNGVELVEPYVTSETFVSGSHPQEVEVPFVVPEGKIFVLGDNRAVSEDSRHFGCVSIEQVEGKAVFRIFPFSKIGFIK